MSFSSDMIMIVKIALNNKSITQPTFNYKHFVQIYTHFYFSYIQTIIIPYEMRDKIEKVTNGHTTNDERRKKFNTGPSCRYSRD